MQKKSFHIFFILSVFILNASAQSISGKIISKTTKKPIPFATITTSSKRGTYADSIGVFRMTGTYQDSDSIQFKILGYQTLKMAVADAKKTKVFELTENATDLTEVIVNKRRKNELLIGSKAKHSSGKYTLIGSEFCIFIFNDEQKEGFLKNVDVYLESDKDINANFRLTIYPSLDSEKEILKEDIHLGNGTKNKGWFTINLSKHYLQVLNQGFYVSLTLLADENGIPPINIGLSEGFEGGVIHARKRDEFSGWTDWHRYKKIEENNVTYYAMIRAILDFYD